MAYQLLADLVVAVHFGFIVFALLGGLLVWRWPWLAWLHLPALAWAALVELTGWLCPLTPLEWWLREQAGQAGYDTGFIAHYLIPIIYPAGLTAGVQKLLGAVVLLVNGLVYGGGWYLKRRR